MSEVTSNNKRIAKNTMLLYVRMFVMMGLSLYTSRITLSILGIENYGIYNIVGGVVGFLSFLNGSLSSSSARFLTFELGRGDQARLNNTFSTVLFIHVMLAVLMALLLESVGLWFILHKMVVPPERLNAAIYVFHFSVLACMIQILQLPFNAEITSHEDMSVFAYISIFDVVMKLLIVFALQIFAIDKLKLYATLLFGVCCLSALIYMTYAMKHYRECRLSIHADKTILRPILTFSGWDLFGNFSVVVRGQGLSILLNMFFGPVLNAASGVANQVMAVVMGFSANFLSAVRPQIVKYYAQNKITQFCDLIINSSKFSTLLLLLVSFPIFTEANFVFHAWLVTVPDYAVLFCQIVIVNNWISIMFRSIINGIHATGNAKRISLINGSVYLLVLPFSYILLKFGYGPTVPFTLNVLLLIIGHFIFTLRTMRAYVPEFPIGRFLKESTGSFVIILMSVLVASGCVHYYLEEGWIRFIVNSITSTLAIVLISWFGFVTPDMKKKIVYQVKKRLKR